MDIPLPHCYAYPRAGNTVDAVVFIRKDNAFKVLLIQRKIDPFKNCWAIPGGFIEMDETMEQAAHRELQEETGLTGITLQRVDVFDAVDRDPRGRTISVAYTGFVSPEQAALLNAGDDAMDARWYDLNALPKLGFDHPEIIKAAREKLGI